MKVWVLLKTTDYGHETDVKVHYVCETYEQILAKMERIREANPKYELHASSTGAGLWWIGPEYNDDAVFGDAQISFQAYEKELDRG